MNKVKNPLKALVIEDSEDDALLLNNALKRGGFQLESARVDDPQALTTALRQGWDIVFCDYSMPTMNGIEALEIVRRETTDVPFVFVSGTIGEELAAEAMRLGAQDYIMKGNFKRLLPAVQRELRAAQSRRKHREAEERLLYIAHHDELTGLPNRAYFLHQLSNLIDQQKTTGQLLAVVYMDLDRFKTVNESLGYEAGNLLLQKTALRLLAFVPDNAILARFGADEFAMILPNVSTRQEVLSLLDKIQNALSKSIMLEDWTLYVSASLGACIYPDDGEDAATLLRNADIATSRVKKEGGKQHKFFMPDMAVRLEERLELDHAMRRGLLEGEFELHYQPQIDLSSGQIIGVEALIRWQRGNETRIGPDVFIPLAEETGFILPLGDWILDQACIQAQQWLKMGLPPIRMAVNLSARQFYQDTLVDRVVSNLATYGLQADYLELEVTETALLHDPLLARRSLQKLHQQGIKVALDDFGTGYSSLCHLKNFKVDCLKIDRVFVNGIPQDKDDMAITAGVIAMAEKLRIQVVAEGVETQEQYDFLKAEGCAIAQGYFMARPVPAAEIAALFTGD